MWILAKPQMPSSSTHLEAILLSFCQKRDSYESTFNNRGGAHCIKTRYIEEKSYLKSVILGWCIGNIGHVSCTYITSGWQNSNNVTVNLQTSVFIDYLEKIVVKGQLNSEWIYEIIVSPKVQTKNLKDFCPGSLLKGRVEILQIFGWHFGRNDDIIN